MTEQKSRPRWSDDPWSALTMDEAAAWRAGYAAAKAQAFEIVACGCPHRDAVTKVPPNSAERWRLCGDSACAAVEAAAIAAMEPPA
jgi:hypothetical protein